MEKTIELNEQQAEFIRDTLMAIDFDKISGTSKSIISQILVKLDAVEITIERDYFEAKSI